MGQAHFGKLREPARYLQEVIDLGIRSGQKILYPAGQGYVGLASIYLEWNDLEAAEKTLQQGVELCSQAGLDGVFSGLILKARLRQAKGDLKGALEEIQSVEKSFQRKDHETTARQGKSLLAMGDIWAASGWVMPLTALLNADPATRKVPPLFLEVFKLTLARILLARGEVVQNLQKQILQKQALQLLDDIQSEAGPARRFGHLIEVYLLRALAVQKQCGGDISPQALEYLELALELAEPEGYTLLFLEAGVDVTSLLNALIHYPFTAARLKKYAAGLLAAFSGDEFTTVSLAATVPALSEEKMDLSDREIEILRLIGEGRSNQEIAKRLFITIHTVKKHSSHIYAKLGVTSRTQAVARARQAGLL